MRGRIPKANKQLVQCAWLDAAGYIGSDQAEAKPAACNTVGWLMSVNSDHIVLSSSIYEDGSGDWTVLPVGMITHIKEVKQSN